MSGRELDVLVEGHSFLSDDVEGLLRLSDDLGIAGHLEDGRLGGAVEDGERGMSIVLAGDDIDALPWDELRLAALDDEGIALTPMEESGEPVEHGVLSGCASYSGEAVVGVARESAREVAADIAIGDLLRTVHEHLGAVVELWGAVDGP